MNLNEQTKYLGNKTLKKLINDKISSLCKIWGLPEIEVCFSLRGKTAGVFEFSFTENKAVRFKFNLILAEENQEDFIANTVSHEFAHYLTFARHGIIYNKRGVVHHGAEWKQAMGVEPIRCHKYDTTSVQRTV